MSQERTPTDNVHRCQSCGSALKMLGYKHVEQVGKVKVADATGMVLQCVSCESAALTLGDLAGYERRAAALVLRDGAHVDGDVIRYARKALGLRQAELAVLLQCTAETISRWENGANPMKRAEQLALVALLDGVERDGVDLQAQLKRRQVGDGNGKGDAEMEVVRRAC
jgi:DNA-binding transcriptional regulator YiaG